MQNEIELGDNVDVSTHASRARERINNGSGKLHRVIDAPETAEVEKDTIWRRLRRILPGPPRFLAAALPSNWEHVTVNKNVDSVTMPKWIAVGLLSAIVLIGIQVWRDGSAQHDALIRIETKLELAEKQKLKDDTERQRLDGDMQAWRETMNGNLKEIKGMLTQQQINALERLNNKKLNQVTDN